jgi:hypothetical protein
MVAQEMRLYIGWEVPKRQQWSHVYYYIMVAQWESSSALERSLPLLSLYTRVIVPVMQN